MTDPVMVEAGVAYGSPEYASDTRKARLHIVDPETKRRSGIIVVASAYCGVNIKKGYGRDMEIDKVTCPKCLSWHKKHVTLAG